MEYRNKKVLVIGLARSGMAAIKVLHQLGAQIYLSERKAPSENEIKELEEMGVTIYDQDMSVFEKDYDLVIKNPGDYIAITGTNGKTTTTTIVYELLKKAFKEKALVGGNIGTPLCELVLDHDLMHQEGYYISLEISNHQLVDIDRFRPQIATIINLTPDHLETMGSLDAYYKSKTEVYRNMREDDVFIVNSDDATLKDYLLRYPPACKTVDISLENKDSYSYIEDGFMYVDHEKVLPLDKIHLVGKHNRQNIIIAITAAKLLGISNEDIIETIDSFKGVEHGVSYYNDSKGTNTDATITALDSFEKGVILLVGGYEKGLDMSEMRKHLTCVKQIIGFGASGKRIASDLWQEPIIVSDLVQAVNEAKKIAQSGDIVLLSPTTSSFDQYSGYEERGRHFKSIVNAL